MLIVLGDDGEMCIEGIICLSLDVYELSNRLLVPPQWDTAFTELCSQRSKIWRWGWRVDILRNSEQRNTIRTEAFFFPRFLTGHGEKPALRLVPSPKGGCWQAHNSRGL